ncbi:unnamed protein product [Porites lobata]|uniref:Uncharacterized protein n=1 Tax=Porites lobata TaxID=104759 RepID=A0ABN8MP24_9CNID|nr:unnamed protein product [Porites lobata]
MSKLTPFIQDSVGSAMEQLSTKVKPKKKYKTDRKDLDGRSGKGITPMDVSGRAIDIHKQILKVAPRKSFVLPGHNYTRPGKPLESQLKYDPETGEILEIYEQPTGRTDAVSMQHDVDYCLW